MWTYLLWALGFSLFINTVMFLITYFRRADTLAHIAYPLTCLVVTGIGLLQLPLTPFSIGLGAMIGIWALRLGGFLLLRIWVSGQDERFSELRTRFWRFGRFWAGQAIMAWAILLPALLALSHPYIHLSWICLAGIGLWLMGLAIETVADFQKFVFGLRKQNDGKWIDAGLWHYSRHPNYFGEITLWVGIFIYCTAALIPIETLTGAISPLSIATLLLFVTGIPPLEKIANSRWGTISAYKTYKQTTGMLIPLPKRHR
jgi:steroid 5-alpha reductase family enzyme